MYGHHRDLIGVFLFIVILIGEQGYLRQEVGHGDLPHALLTPDLAKLSDTFQQLLQVLLLAHALYGTVLKQVGNDAATLHHQGSQFLCGEFFILFNENFNQTTEIAQFLSCTIIYR